MATGQQRKFGAAPLRKPKAPVRVKSTPVDIDPDTGLPWSVVREQQQRLKAEFLERQARREQQIAELGLRAMQNLELRQADHPELWAS